MKKLLLLIAIIGLCTAPTLAQNNNTRFFTAYDHETITVSTSAVPLTASKVTPPSKAYRAEAVGITIECATGTSCPIRFLMDGGVPTSTVGTLVDYQYSMIVYNYDNILNFSMIRAGSTNATIQVVYYR